MWNPELQLVLETCMYKGGVVEVVQRKICPLGGQECAEHSPELDGGSLQSNQRVNHVSNEPADWNERTKPESKIGVEIHP